MRLKNIIVTNLIHDRLIAYEELEVVMNSKGDVKNQVSKIKKLLKEITNINMMLTEWESITKNPLDSLKEKINNPQSLDNKNEKNE